MFAMADPFRSERLIYRAIELPGDEEIFMATRQDPIAYVQVYSHLHVPRSRERVAEFAKKIAQQSLIAVIICLPSPDQSSNPIPIGWIDLGLSGQETRQHRKSEIGLCLLEPYRNRGYGSEAIQWIVGWGFKTAGLHRIGVWAYEFNERALKVYERLGFVREAVIRESHFYDGRWWNEVVMGILEHEWRAREEKGKDGKASAAVVASSP